MRLCSVLEAFWLPATLEQHTLAFLGHLLALPLLLEWHWLKASSAWRLARLLLSWHVQQLGWGQVTSVALAEGWVLMRIP